MKEIISVLIVVASLVGGVVALKEFHTAVRKAALKKAAQGMPSLTKMADALTKKKRAGRK